MSSFIFNSQSRDALDNRYNTPNFKTIYPDFNTWEQALISFGIDSNDIYEKDFNLLQTMIGNAPMRYTTQNKNFGFVYAVYKQELFKLKRRKAFINLSMDELITDMQTSSQTLYTIDRTLSGEAIPEYIDNKVVNELKNVKSPVEYYDVLAKHSQLEDPELLFVMNIAYQIVFPLQQSQLSEKGLL